MIIMEVDISTLLGPGGIYLIIFLILLVVLIIILSLINKNLEKKVIIKEKEKEKESKLLKEIENLKASKSQPKIALDSINIIARNFFSENFNINKSLDYSEIMDTFQENKNKKAVSFCEEMLEALYAGRKINEAKINQLISSLENLIETANPRLKVMQEKMILNMQKTAFIETSRFASRSSNLDGAQELKSNQKVLDKEKPKAEQKILEPKIAIPAKPPVLTPIKLNVAPVIKPVPLLSSMPKEPSKTAQQTQPSNQLNDIEKDFKKSNEEQIREAYKELQRKYEEAYEKAKKNAQKENMEKLEKFREEIARIIDEYEKDNFKIVELAQGISKGARLLRLTGNL